MKRRRRVGGCILAVLVVSAGNAFLPSSIVGATTAGPGTGPSELSWHVEAAYAKTTVPPLNGAACGSETDCVAVGQNGTGADGVVTTSDGGGSWTSRSVYTKTAVLTLRAVACPSATRCIALGSALTGVTKIGEDVALITNNGGSTWSHVVVPGLMNGISCPTATVCVAVGGDAAARSTDGGTAWVPATVPLATTVSLTGVSCGSSADCVAVGMKQVGLDSEGYVLLSTDGGASWTAGVISSDGLQAVACPSASTCVAIGRGTSGTRIETTADGGGSWTGDTARDVFQPSAVACATVTDCLVVGSAGTLVTTDGGAGWTDAPVVPDGSVASAMTCPSSSSCVAVGAGTTGGGGHLIGTDKPFARAALTTTTMSISPADATEGQTVTFSATVTSSAGTPNQGRAVFFSSSTEFCSAPVRSGHASCHNSVFSVGPGQVVTGRYVPTTIQSGYASSTTTAVLSVAPSPPSPPEGATTSDSASSASATGDATAQSGNVGAVGSGFGSVTVANYAGNPSGVAIPNGTGAFYDVEVGTGSNFSTVTITICDPGMGTALQWFDGSTWARFSSQTTSNGCLVATVNGSTTPTLTELTGTILAVTSARSAPPPTPSPSPVPSPAPAPAPTPPAAAAASGYDLVGSDGGVFVFPNGQSGGFYGSLPGLDVHVSDVVGIVPSSDDRGYFLVGADGGVFSFGDTSFEGSLPGLGVSVRDIAGIVPTSDDRGYFLVGADGGVFAFGDAPFLGSLPGLGVHLSDVIGIAATPDDQGYWLVAANGAVYGFGDAGYYGNAIGSSSPVAGIAASPSGRGYWIVAQNGNVIAFGDAGSFGSLPALGVTPTKPIVALVPTADQQGYWLIGADGGVFAFGDAPSVGSLPGLGVNVGNIVGGVPTKL